MQKIGANYAPGDISYACSEERECGFWRIVAGENDDLEIGENDLYVNMEAVKKNIDIEDRETLKDFALMGGWLLMKDGSGDLLQVRRPNLRAKCMIVLRIRNF